VSDEESAGVRPRNTIVRKKTKTSSDRPHLRIRKRAHRDALAKLNVHKPARACRARDLKIMAELKDMFRETWASLRDKAQDMHRFSEKQLKFARQYAINGRTNLAEAVRLAGYNIKDDYNYSTHGRQLLKLPGMEELVQAFEFEEKARMKINVDDVVAWFHKIATAAMAAEDFTNANRAMESLAKYLGMFVERKEITHKTVHNRAELDAQIAEYQRILAEGRDEINAKLTIN
jgi:hypothetical protein